MRERLGSPSAEGATAPETLRPKDRAVEQTLESRGVARRRSPKEKAGLVSE